MTAEVEALLQILRDGLSVLVTRDGVPLTPAQIDERARNLAQSVLCWVEDEKE